MKNFISFCVCILLQAALSAQQDVPGLDYYLPQTTYNQAIPTPEQYLGYRVGAWHATHDQLLGYMRTLAQSSNRIHMLEYGRSHENRPLVCLIFSDPANLGQLEQIAAGRKNLADPEFKGRLDLDKMPAVNYMGYSIHGNETSGSNAALIVAYYLAAADNEALTNLLKNTVILFDPCFNPDGMQRFSGWINSHKSKNNAPDPAGDEYNEPWPRGRTNHYGFDLNRDWLVCRQPESAGRVDLFQKWKPNVLTDHHEMGSNATFFFQPGVPSRTNPITPVKNQELTTKIAQYHASALSAKQIPFYTKENFDDFYYGKGSTYPDAQGAIGILFEQASSRGSAQETENGLLTFPYSIRNQVITSLSTLKAVGEMRVELNQYLREFYATAKTEAAKSGVGGYVFEDGDVPAREFLNLLLKQGIAVQNLTENLKLKDREFQANNAFLVRTAQPQYRLIRAIFERPTSFRDSIFYDISAWTLPDAFGLNWASMDDKTVAGIKKQDFIGISSLNPPGRLIEEPVFGYAIPPFDYNHPEILYRLLQHGVRVKVALEPFECDGMAFSRGTALINMDRQPLPEKEIFDLMQDLATQGSGVMPLKNGLSQNGPDLGSAKFPVLRLPKIAMATGEGVNIADAGQIWHQLDTRYNMPLTMVESDRLGGVNLNKYNVLILPDGNMPGLSAEKVKQFAQDGGVVIATGRTMNWLKTNGLIHFEARKSAGIKNSKRAYEHLEEDRAAMAMPGAIFEAELDLSHPICFGYKSNQLPVFMGDTLFVNPAKNPYATPVQLRANPLLAGYVHPVVLPMAPGAAAVQVYGLGRGKVIVFAIDPNFRAFWYATNRLFANAVFYGNLIATESAEKK